MQYEVENKFRVNDMHRWEERLQQLGAEFGPAVEQTDVYFAHPTRDFAATDEALRIRRIGQRNWVTYKGPKVDQATKTRHELELPLAEGEEYVARYSELLESLGFRTVAEVCKLRRRGQCRWDDWSVEIALDEVAQLGHFIELEIVVSQEALSRSAGQSVGAGPQARIAGAGTSQLPGNGAGGP